MPKRSRRNTPPAPRPVDQCPRIIGGRFRGHKLLYHGDRRTRPMKERVREAVFNLIGPSVAGKHVIDLFAGTGALGLEAISRGAAGATFVEKHFPTAAVIEQNIAAIEVSAQCDVVPGDTFLWVRRSMALPEVPWLVLCSPPYSFYVDRCDEMLRLLQEFYARASAASVIVVEADERFDFGLLPDAQRWDVRRYPPAMVGIYRKQSV